MPRTDAVRVTIEWPDDHAPTVLEDDEAGLAGRTIRLALGARHHAWSRVQSGRVFPPQDPGDQFPDYVLSAVEAIMGGVVQSVATFYPSEDGGDSRVALQISCPDEEDRGIELHVEREQIEDALRRMEDLFGPGGNQG